jgi:hypothetical protein
MADIIARAVEWAASPGPPNAVFLVAVLTAPWLWAGYAKDGAQRLLDRVTGGSSEPTTDTQQNG